MGKMSKDRVLFHLVNRYYSRYPSENSMAWEDCQRVCLKAFGLSPCEFERLALANKEEGRIRILCRPSQFARFIIYRHKYGKCINGVRDLDPTLLNEGDLYERDGREALDAMAENVRHRLGWGRDTVDSRLVSAVLDELEIDIRDRIDQPWDVDVSTRPKGHLDDEEDDLL